MQEQAPVPTTAASADSWLLNPAPLDREGRWKGRILVDGPAGPATAGFTFNVYPARPVLPAWRMVDPAADAVPLRTLAARMHRDPSNISLLCVQLEDRGFAERRPHPRDGRIRTLVLTEKGADVRQRLIALVTARSPLSVLDDAEQRQLHLMLTKALAAL